MGRSLALEYIKEDRGYKTKCWIWQGALHKNGYGYCNRHFHLGECRPHRYYYRKYKGAIPKDFDIEHRCRVRSCINPAHLVAMTHVNNCRQIPAVVLEHIFEAGFETAISLLQNKFPITAKRLMKQLPNISKTVQLSQFITTKRQRLLK